MYPPYFDGTIPNGTTKYIGIRDGDHSLVGIQISRLTGAGADVITLETSEFPADQAPVTTAGTYEWVATGEAITTPAAGASTQVHLGNIGSGRMRLKIVAGADARYIIRGRHKLS